MELGAQGLTIVITIIQRALGKKTWSQGKLKDSQAKLRSQSRWVIGLKLFMVPTSSLNTPCYPVFGKTQPQGLVNEMPSSLYIQNRVVGATNDK